LTLPCNGNVLAEGLIGADALFETLADVVAAYRTVRTVATVKG